MVEMANITLQMNTVIILSGLSGSGKTTLGKEFTKQYPEYELIDIDTFFKKVKPKITLSSGEEVSNWDCLEAIDWDKLNEYVIITLKDHPVILTGFAPWQELLNFPVKIHVHLSYGDELIERCIEARRASKGFQDPKRMKRDELMVKEVVVPFYEKSMKHSKIDQVINVFENGKRVPLEKLMGELRGVIFFDGLIQSQRKIFYKNRNPQ